MNEAVQNGDYAQRVVHVHWIDWAVIAAYLIILVLIGVYHSRKQTNIQEYFLASRSMRWLPIGLSLMAALNTGTDYLIQPSAMVQYGPLILTGPLTWFILYPYVFFIILPFYRRLGVVSAYEFLEYRFSPAVRSLMALIFLLWQVLLGGMMLYAPCLAMASAMRRDDLLVPMIVVLGLIVTLYVTLGGIKGVIWVDVAQFWIMFVGLTATLTIIFMRVPGGVGAIVGNLDEVGFDTFPMPETHNVFGWTKEYFLLSMSASGIFWVTLLGRVNIYTCNQVMIQRFQTSRTIRDARQGFFITAVGDFLWVTTLSLMGVALYTYYVSLNDGRLPADFLKLPDRILPAFIADAFPIGMTGLVMAAIWAASLSAYDGILSALTTVTMVDFVKRYLLRDNADASSDSERSQRFQVMLSRLITLGFGVLAIAVATYARTLGTLIEIGLKIVQCFSGPILAVFLAGMFLPVINRHGAFWGAIAGALAGLYGLVWTSPGMYHGEGAVLAFINPLFPNPDVYRHISLLWIGTMGFLATLIVATVISVVTPRDPEAHTWSWWTIVKTRPLQE